jgi:hypothetical protein
MRELVQPIDDIKMTKAAEFCYLWIRASHKPKPWKSGRAISVLLEMRTPCKLLGRPSLHRYRSAFDSQDTCLCCILNELYLLRDLCLDMQRQVAAQKRAS